jgi:hypothetical protein
VPPDVAVQVMKIDVEGYELFAMRGATALLAEKRVNFIFSEYSPSMLFEKGVTEPADYLRLLMEYGYEIRHIRRGFNVHTRIASDNIDSFCKVHTTCDLFIFRQDLLK